jgi:pyruvate-ferredoxin/flavodoxin oxidoreductase
VIEMQSEAGALLASNSVQEAQDLALVAHASTLEARVPFLHFFDGFRTSHEINRIEQLTSEDIQAMIDDSLVQAHRNRARSPDHPFIRGTAHNADVYFQARETTNPYYQACPTIVQQKMDQFASVVGRHYHLFDYAGAPDAERVIILMGSGAETTQATAEYLIAQGEKVGVLKVRLFRPFSVEHFLQALPATVQSIAVLDRTKEPGSIGEPLYMDVVAALREGQRQEITVIGGRYGLIERVYTRDGQGSSTN